MGLTSRGSSVPRQGVEPVFGRMLGLCVRLLSLVLPRISTSFLLLSAVQSTWRTGLQPFEVIVPGPRVDCL